MRPSAPCLIALILSLVTPLIHAQSADTVRAVVHEFLRGQTAGMSGKIHIEVGTPTIPAHMPQCERLEPWLPNGARAWGSVRVGVRCIGQGNWALYVPAQVSITASYLAAARALRPGDILGAADLELRDGEITAMGRHLLTDPTQALGRQMRFAVGQGQPLRATMMAAPVVVQSGRPVKVIVQGPGFTAANAGTALGNARVGEAVRVRLASGKVISGIATDNGDVAVSP